MLNVIILTMIGILQILKMFSVCEYMIKDCQVMFKTGYHLNCSWLLIQCYLFCNPCICDIFVWAMNNCCCKIIERYCIHFLEKNIMHLRHQTCCFSVQLPCNDVGLYFLIIVKEDDKLITMIFQFHNSWFLITE